MPFPKKPLNSLKSLGYSVFFSQPGAPAKVKTKRLKSPKNTDSNFYICKGHACSLNVFSIHASKARDENTFLTNKETANFGRLSM